MIVEIVKLLETVMVRHWEANMYQLNYAIILILKFKNL